MFFAENQESALTNFFLQLYMHAVNLSTVHISCLLQLLLSTEDATKQKDQNSLCNNICVNCLCQVLFLILTYVMSWRW